MWSQWDVLPVRGDPETDLLDRICTDSTTSYYYGCRDGLFAVGYGLEGTANKLNPHATLDSVLEKQESTQSRESTQSQESTQSLGSKISMESVPSQLNSDGSLRDVATFGVSYLRNYQLIRNKIPRCRETQVDHPLRMDQPTRQLLLLNPATGNPFNWI